MLRLVALTVALLVLLVALPGPAAAQDHDHGSGGEGLLLIADTPPDGRTRVGDITHFSYVILDDETDDPQPHNDVHVHVTLDGIDLYRTESAHDYDGVGGFDIVFPMTGTYNVTVTVPGDPARVAHFAGYVVPMADPVDVELVVEQAPATTDAGALADFTYRLDGPGGAIVPHSDALVEVRRLADDFPVLQVHTHTHDAPMSFAYAFERPGAHLVRITAYTAFPSEDATAFLPVTKTLLVDVVGDPAPLPLVGPVDTGDTDDTDDAAAGRTGQAGGETGRTTPAAADPDAKERRYAITADPVAGTSHVAGPFSQVRMSTVAFEEGPQRLLQHTDHDAELTGPYGTVFRSSSLHEYDGVLEIMSASQTVGDYTWTVGVPGTDTPLSYTYQVLPAYAPAFGAGPQFIDVDGLDKLVGGRTGDVGFFVHGVGDVPFQHGEVAFRLDDAAGVPILQHKLHTHATGTFAFSYTPPAPGSYHLQVDPFDVHGSPTPRYYGSTIGDPRGMAFTVNDGTALGSLAGDTDATVQEATPGPVVPLVLLAFALTALAAARRRLG